MTYERINGHRIVVEPLAERKSFIHVEKAAISPNTPPVEVNSVEKDRIDRLATKIRSARERGASIMVAYGAHLVKNGCGLLLRQLIDDGWVTHLATQGAGIIHDWEFAFLGKSSESVRDNAPVGRFGTWDETGKYLNLAVLSGVTRNEGLGEAVGRMIENERIELMERETILDKLGEKNGEPKGAYGDLLSMMDDFGLDEGMIEIKHPWKQYSITHGAFATCVPLTVHPGLGYDIYCCHPMFTAETGAAIGRASAMDFHCFTKAVENLTEGVFISIGSAIMAPQVFEKAFSIANNLRQERGESLIQDHHIAVVDIQDGGDWDWSSDKEPSMQDAAYYLRWCKTFARMTHNATHGGSMDYIQCDNRAFLQHLAQALRNE